MFNPSLVGWVVLGCFGGCEQTHLQRPSPRCAAPFPGDRRYLKSLEYKDRLPPKVEKKLLLPDRRSVVNRLRCRVCPGVDFQPVEQRCSFFRTSCPLVTSIVAVVSFLHWSSCVHAVNLRFKRTNEVVFKRMFKRPVGKATRPPAPSCTTVQYRPRNAALLWSPQWAPHLF